MELALNLLWLACAVTLSALLGRRLMHERGSAEGGPAWWQSLVMLACALTILFPVISMTDDLAEMQCLIEEAPLRGGTQVRARGATAAQPGGPELWLGSLERVRGRTLPGIMVGRVQDRDMLFARPQESHPSISRAPPVTPA